MELNLDLDLNEVDQLVELTRGMLVDKIKLAAKNYKSTGELKW